MKDQITKWGNSEKELSGKSKKKKKIDKLQLSMFVLVSDMMTIQAGVLQILKKGYVLSTT